MLHSVSFFFKKDLPPLMRTKFFFFKPYFRNKKKEKTMALNA